MNGAFEWDEGKAAANIDKHGIDFEDAIGIFRRFVLDARSEREGEQRWKAVGVLGADFEVAVIYTWREGRRRIISARRARRNERRAYHQAHPGGSEAGED